MGEGTGPEIAQRLNERGRRARPPMTRHERIVEIGEAILLAVVAIVTAWSGYQSARWDGLSAEQYAEASRYRVEQDLAATRSGQQRLFNASNLDAWITATLNGDREAAAVFAKRFTPNYRKAFTAWLQTHPLADPSAPADPTAMPQYRSPLDEQAARLDLRATEAFDGGMEARETGEDYVRTTVLVATVLFLVAISQRFRIPLIRLSLVGVGLAILTVAVWLLISFPRI